MATPPGLEGYLVQVSLDVIGQILAVLEERTTLPIDVLQLLRVVLLVRSAGGSVFFASTKQLVHESLFVFVVY
jgi:hypothetical protein